MESARAITRRKSAAGICMRLAAVATWAATATAVALSALPAAARDKPAKPDTSGGQIEAIEVSAQSLAGFDKANADRRQFGALEWLGGVVLTSSDKRFGGWSGLVVDADGKRLVAVSDAGTWMTADIAYDGSRVQGLRNARLGPLKAKDGGPLKRDRDRDAEALVLMQGTLERGQLLIGFEQNHRMGRFDITSDGVQAPSRYVQVPAGAKRMRALKGFEAIAEVKAGRHKGALIAFAEHLLDRDGHHSGWIMSGGKEMRFALTDIDGFDPTDAVGLANGDIILLERRFRWTEGVKMRLRRLSAAEMKPGALVRGKVLIEASMTEEIDNMEALAAHRSRSGDTILTLMSDDNFNSFLQRTVLLQFRLRDERTAGEAQR